MLRERLRQKLEPKLDDALVRGYLIPPPAVWSALVPRKATSFKNILFY